MNKSGFTLIELIIYIAITSVLATVTVELATNLVRTRVKSSVQENVIHNLRFASRRIQSEITQATTIELVDPTKICLNSNNPARNPVQIYISGGVLYLGTNGSCSTPATSHPLTSNSIIVSNLQFSNTSQGSSAHIDFSFDLNYNSASTRVEWNYATTASGSATLR